MVDLLIELGGFLHRSLPEQRLYLVLYWCLVQERIRLASTSHCELYDIGVLSVTLMD